MKTIEEINKKFDKKFGQFLVGQGDKTFGELNIKKFYTQQILSLIEELEGKLPKKEKEII
jgi:hypothetical protein